MVRSMRVFRSRRVMLQLVCICPSDSECPSASPPLLPLGIPLLTCTPNAQIPIIRLQPLSTLQLQLHLIVLYPHLQLHLHPRHHSPSRRRPSELPSGASGNAAALSCTPYTRCTATRPRCTRPTPLTLTSCRLPFAAAPLRRNQSTRRDLYEFIHASNILGTMTTPNPRSMKSSTRPWKTTNVGGAAKTHRNTSAVLHT